MVIWLILLGILVIAGIFLLPVRYKHGFTALPVLAVMTFSSMTAVQVLSGLPDGKGLQVYEFPGLESLPFYLDGLSAFFILTVNFTVLTGFLYARNYLRMYTEKQSPLSFSIHYLSLLLLYLSMLLVCTQQGAFPFLVSWELMTLSSFVLVIFDTGKRSTLKTGINYLVQMHISMFFLLAAFLLTPGLTLIPEPGMATWSHDHMSTSFILFFFFFAGFAIKAGFIPFHTWLPQAHPAAPSHVSGIMSGVMIKMGIYGIMRVLLVYRGDWMTVGVFLLVISVITGIYGVLQAIVQHDLKKLLAYHSIENIGIIGMGIGLGCIGMGLQNPLLALLGFGGGLLHVLNHSLFKSLLFYGAGNVYKATHSRTLDELGGIGKRMPYTAFFFLLGSIAICGLPPLNGFISEYLIYLGMIQGLNGFGLYTSVLVILSMLGLTLIGGLAIFCFTKAFGVVFLGQARSDKALLAGEGKGTSFLPEFLVGIPIVAIGLFPLVFLNPLLNVVVGSFNLPMSVFECSYLTNLKMISMAGGTFLFITLILLAIRYLNRRDKPSETGPTWGCGYTAGSAAMQYTATSYADNLSELAGSIVNVKKEFDRIPETEIFPIMRKFSAHSSELLETVFIDRPVLAMRQLLRKIAFLQTGKIQHYILYPFVFILFILVLSLLGLI
ncbi:MAG: proton-conducting transporter membrane subunit [Bacteroidetes bacterium]|nr:proton-conducting transporter membrane subunit [Bacteroidota bacterium]